MRYIKTLRKPLSVLLTFILLVNANISVLAQNISVSTNDFVLGSATLRAEIKERLNIIDEQYIKDFYRNKINLRQAIYDVDYQGKINNYGEVCYNDICAPYHIYMRGLIGALLEYTEGDWEVFQNYITEIRNAAFAAAISSEDIPQIKEILKTIVEKNKSSCGNMSVFEELWETAQENLNIKDKDFSKEEKNRNNCQKALDSLTMLAVLTESAQDAKNTADYIYRFLKKYQDETYANLVLMETIVALTFIDTDYSYSLIEKFLTEDTTPSITGNKAREALSMFMPSGIFESVRRQILEEGLHETKYLNRLNEGWQYINTAATEREGINIFWLTNAAYDVTKDSNVSYRIVFNNILTDIGDFLSSSGERGKKLANKIVNNYVNSGEEDRQTMHLPLILGLIQNLDLEDAKPAAEILNKNFYYDINGGTGKMIANMTALPNSGLVVNSHNVMSERSFHALENTRNVLMAADIVVTLISLISLARSMPAIISKLKDLRSIRAINKAVSVAKAGNVSSNVTKAAPAFNQIAAVGKTSTALTFGRGALNIKSLALTPAKIAKPAVSANTLNAALKFRKGLQSKGLLSSRPQLTLTSTSATQHAANISAQTAVMKAAAVPATEEAAQTSELSNSVFRLENINGQLSGFLAEVPVYGVKRQVIITAGHGVTGAPGATTEIYDRFGNFVDNAHTMLFDKTLSRETIDIGADFALLLPEHKIPARPLDLNFGNIYDLDEVIKVGFPHGEFNTDNVSPDLYMSYSKPARNIYYLRGPNENGLSGGPVVAETAPNKFSVFGILSATIENTEGAFTLVNNLNWLEKLINLQPFSAHFRFPVHPPVNFIFSKPKFVHNMNHITDIRGVIPRSNLASVMGFKHTSLPADRPYLPIENFDGYENATLFPMGNIGKKMNPVWGIYDFRGHINKFLMYGTETDVFRMRIFDRMIKGNDLKGKYELVDIEYPEFISAIEEGLPDNVIDDFYEIRGNNKDFSRPLLMPYTTTPIKFNGSIWVEDDPAMNATFREKSDFANKPITPAEWDEVLALIQDINNNDFIVQDFAKSILLGRNTQGKLIVRFIKLKDTLSQIDNYNDVISIGKKLEREGLKLKRGSIVQKPEIKLANTPDVLKNVNRAELVVTEIDNSLIAHAVWRLYDNNNKVVGYLKFGTEDEIINTKKLHKIITENNLLEKFEGVKISYPQILAESVDSLPKNVLDDIYEKYERIKIFIRNPKDRAKLMFVVSPVDESGFCWGNVGADKRSLLFAQVKLNNKPISTKEWDIIFRFFSELEQYGFSYDDLYNNLFLKRDRDNNLIMTMIDFENEGTPNMLSDLQLLGNKFNQIGIKEQHYYWDRLALDAEENSFPF